MPADQWGAQLQNTKHVNTGYLILKQYLLHYYSRIKMLHKQRQTLYRYLSTEDVIHLLLLLLCCTASNDRKNTLKIDIIADEI